jgi:hypothetical protein
MAYLTPEQILRKIEAPTNGVSLFQAVSHERSIQVHTEPVDGDFEYQEGHSKLLSWVSSVIGSPKKYARFLQFVKFPYFTNDITEAIFTQLSAVFDSRNSFRKYNFKSPEQEVDFIKYLADTSDSFFWKNDIWEHVKNNINSVLVVDMSTDQTTTPSPYSYLVKVEDIVDMENTVVKSTTVDKKVFKSFKMEYLIFRDNGKIIALDDGHYRVFEKNEGENHVMTIETPHSLGYCPSTQIYSTPFNSRDNIRKKGPVSTTISDLDMLFYFGTFNKYSDSFIPNPITIEYATQCSYMTDDGYNCVDGKISRPTPYAPNEYNVFDCPICSAESIIGPGETREVQPPSSSEEHDQIDAIRFIQPPLEGIKYMGDKQVLSANEILLKTTGITEDIGSEQAKNIPQIMSKYESRKKILRGIAVNLEIAQKFQHSTMAKLKYADDFNDCTIFFGDEFFLETEKQLQEKYTEEKDNGNSEYELSLSRDKITETKHKNNPNLLRVAKFLSYIEPFQGQTIAGVSTMKKDFSTLVPDAQFVIKINFNSFVKRFETEEQPLQMLLSDENKTLQQKITEVNDKLKEYAIEQIALIQVATGVPLDQGGLDVTGEERPDIEAEAKARLKGSVGGVQGLIGIATAVSNGVMSKSSALAILETIYGFGKEEGSKMLQENSNIKQ